MSEAETQTAAPRPTRALCLGEALVDLICEHPAAGPQEATAFFPHLGGSVSNVAVTAARSGARVSLAGAAGPDAWGDWIRARLEQEGVDLTHFGELPDAQTTVAITTVDQSGEARYTFYGDSIGRATPALGAGLVAAVADSAALHFSSNTLVGAHERELTMGARQAALDHDRPIIFDPNLRLDRWGSRTDARASCNACLPGAFLVRAGQAEAALLTGEDDPERAAMALLKAGVRMVVVSLGAEGAILRGELRADVAAVPVNVVSTIGAGDVFTGTLLATLLLSDFYPPSVAAALPQAAAAAAAACGRWGALD